MVGTFALVVAAQPLTAHANPSGNNIVINEVMTRTGGVDPKIANAVEIASPIGNPNGPISLTGWVLQFRDASDVPILEVPLTGSLETGEFVVVEHEDFDRVNQIQFTTASGVDALPDNGGVVLLNAGDTVVDRVGMSPGLSEGSPAPQLFSLTDPFDVSIQRDVFSTDTDNNAADFWMLVSSLGSLN